MARRLIARGIGPGDRIALVAETGPEFAALFCGAIYAGAWPVPLPLPTSFGGKESYIDQLAVQLESADPTMLLYPDRARRDGRAPRPSARAASGMSLGELRRAAEAPRCALPGAQPDDICYLQYSSGSTRFPHGVAVTHRALLNNLAGHAIGMKLGRQRPLRLAGCRGITTWAWSAACSRRSPTRSRSTTSRPRISPAARSPGST